LSHIDKKNYNVYNFIRKLAKKSYFLVFAEYYTLRNWKERGMQKGLLLARTGSKRNCNFIMYNFTKNIFDYLQIY